MVQSIRFLRSCPACRKSLQISVELLGKEVICHNCGSQFTATTGERSPHRPVDEIDIKVAELIEAADRQLQHYHR